MDKSLALNFALSFFVGLCFAMVAAWRRYSGPGVLLVFFCFTFICIVVTTAWEPFARYR